ncbi:hypothetical protein BDV18DRAFT_163996 [Aspergillus unguis]
MSISSSNNRKSMQQPQHSGKPHKKRVITEARKIQNREAQRAYRQRQKERQKERQQADAQKEWDHDRALRPSYSYQQLRPHPPMEHHRPGYRHSHSQPSPDQTLFPAAPAPASWNLPIRAADDYGYPQVALPLSLSPSPCPSAVSGVSLTDPLMPGSNTTTGLVEESSMSLSQPHPHLLSSPEMDPDLFGRTEADMELELDPRILNFQDLNLNLNMNMNPLSVPSNPHQSLDPAVSLDSHIPHSGGEYGQWLGHPAPVAVPLQIPTDQFMVSFAQDNEALVASSMYNHRPPPMYPAPSKSPVLPSDDGNGS